MSELNQNDDALWDRFFDFITEPVDELSQEQIREELRKNNIDTKALKTRSSQIAEPPLTAFEFPDRPG